MVAAVRHTLVDAAHPADPLLAGVIGDFLQRIGDEDRQGRGDTPWEGR